MSVTGGSNNSNSNIDIIDSLLLPPATSNTNNNDSNNAFSSSALPPITTTTVPTTSPTTPTNTTTATAIPTPIPTTAAATNSSTTSAAAKAAVTTMNKKRRNVVRACVYCQKSHTMCDEGRPCQRCIKRKLGHLCHDRKDDDPKATSSRSHAATSSTSSVSYSAQLLQQQKTVTTHATKQYSTTLPGRAGTTRMDGVTIVTGGLVTASPSPSSSSTSPSTTLPSYSSSSGSANGADNEYLKYHPGAAMYPLIHATNMANSTSSTAATPLSSTSTPSVNTPEAGTASTSTAVSYNTTVINNPAPRPASSWASYPTMFASEHMGNEFSVISDFLESVSEGDGSGSGSDSSHSASFEKFLMHAANPADGAPDDRLGEIIKAKFDAGLIKPYNYVRGYSRFQKHIQQNMSLANRQRILNVLASYRPAFRNLTLQLTDMDIIQVEESFERLLLDYDRVFSSIGMPACLWRRTGEICKTNKEFAALVDIPVDSLRSNEHMICIYELLSEDSVVNYWEKYGTIAFDTSQKAVLTSCLLRCGQGIFRPCCFSFTIRRDKFDIPYCIVGNFLPVR